MAEMINVVISSTVSSFGAERRFPTDCTVFILKGKLELITGSTSQFMNLELYDKENKLICKLDDDEKTLGFYGIDNGMRIHVIDTDPSKKAGEFEDVSKVEKYEISNEDYDKKADSVRNFMKQNKLGKFSEEAQNVEERAKQKELAEEERSKSMKIGDRCEVKVLRQPTKRGSVMFIGQTEFKPGVWIGVKYDEPLGKNDGSVSGKRYFECPAKYGGFVRPSQVTVGDFSEELFDEDEI